VSWNSNENPPRARRGAESISGSRVHLPEEPRIASKGPMGMMMKDIASVNLIKKNDEIGPVPKILVAQQQQPTAKATIQSNHEE
jgi:hypothetical protein